MRILDEDTIGTLNVFAEARSEPYEGQLAVAALTRNRTKFKYFSDGTVSGTVFRDRQFSWANSNDRQRTRVFRVDDSDPAWKEAKRAWHESQINNPIGDCVLYHADYIADPFWVKSERVQFVKQIGRHKFYRVKNL